MLSALTVASGHTGVAHPRTGPEISDFGLFACAVLGVWLLRRRMRKRLPKD
jgi:hypothetical protein